MTKCKTILWFQGETATQKDTLLIDGKDAESVGERDDAFNFIIKGRENGNRLLSTINRGAIKVGNRLLKSYELSQIKHKWYLLTNDFKEKRDQRRKEGTNVSPSLLCYEDMNSKILIRSHFLDKDESGRRIVFSFYANTNDMDEACKLLKQLTEPLGKHCNEDDFTFLKDISKKKKTNRTRLAVIFILLIFICVILWIIEH
jgi:hypothetical protein